MTKNVALLRGINVGTAKSLAMPELKAVFETLGHLRVSTVLRSGNVVFEASGTVDARSIEAAVRAKTGVESSVLVLDSSRFAAIAAANPLLEIAKDGSKSFVTFLADHQGDITVPDAASLAPEVLVVGAGAVYQWMPAGSQQTRVPRSFWKQFDSPVTARNWNTVQKILAILDA